MKQGVSSVDWLWGRSLETPCNLQGAHSFTTPVVPVVVLDPNPNGSSGRSSHEDEDLYNLNRTYIYLKYIDVVLRIFIENRSHESNVKINPYLLY